jgi:NAD+ synthase (glutamine-hydrolysing)
MRPTGKAQWRRTLCASQSGRCIAGYVYCSAGGGESTTDLAWDGQALIYENADLLAESERFAVTPHLTIADIDIDRLARERIWFTSFNDCRADNHQRTKSMRRIEFAYVATEADAALRRPIERFPYVPANPARRDERCSEIYNIQIQGLAQRLEAARIPRAVIGLSGGLDSAQALLVGWRPLTGFGVLGPIFSRTRCPASRPAKLRARVQRLIQAVGVAGGEIDIRPAAQKMLKELGHPAARGEAVYYTVFENVQAGNAARTHSELQIIVRDWSSAPATCRNWRSATPRTASAIKCHTTVSMRRCRKRLFNIWFAG